MSSGNAILATSRLRSSWNDRFEHWQRPASDSEEEIIERAARGVRDALAGHAWLDLQGVEVRPQGSYQNNTNVRLESDMDLCAWHPGLLMVAGPGVSYTNALHALDYRPTGRHMPDVASDLRAELGGALVLAFGRSNVVPGTKAFTVSGLPGSRTKADVVPALGVHYVVNRCGVGLAGPYSWLEAIEGVAIYPTNGGLILNFPHQHRLNGIAKRQATSHRFKKVVRILKRLRDELVDLGKLRKGQVPSFLIECLVYRVENEFFLQPDDMYGRVTLALRRIGRLSLDQSFIATALEINDVKPLFAPEQPWGIADVRTFVQAALQRLEI